MITRSGIIQFSDVVYADYTRLVDEEIRGLQDAHNVNCCDECDGWLDADLPDDGTVTIIEELEFWERFGDVEAV